MEWRNEHDRQKRDDKNAWMWVEGKNRRVIAMWTTSNLVSLHISSKCVHTNIIIDAWITKCSSHALCLVTGYTTLSESVVTNLHMHYTRSVHTNTSGALSSPNWNAGWLEVTGTGYVNITRKLKSCFGMASIDLQEGKVCPRVPGTGGNWDMYSSSLGKCGSDHWSMAINTAVWYCHWVAVMLSHRFLFCLLEKVLTKLFPSVIKW